MSATAPQLDDITFMDGDGTPQYQCNGSMVVQNPAGGGAAAVTVPLRAKPFTARLRGLFAAIPNVRAKVGLVVNYVKDGVTQVVYVDDAEIISKSDAWDPEADAHRFNVTASFTLIPTTDA